MELVRSDDLPLWAYCEEEIKYMSEEMIKWTVDGRYIEVGGLVVTNLMKEIGIL